MELVVLCMTLSQKLIIFIVLVWMDIMDFAVRMIPVIKNLVSMMGLVKSMVNFKNYKFTEIELSSEFLHNRKLSLSPR
jgi:hypothetical protein